MPDNSHKRTNRSIQWMARIFILTLLFACCKSARRMIARQAQRGRPLTPPPHLGLQHSFFASSRRELFEAEELGVDDEIDHFHAIQCYELTLNMAISLRDDPDIDQDLVDQHVINHEYNVTIESFKAKQQNGDAITYCDTYSNNYNDYFGEHERLARWRLMAKFWPDLTGVTEFRLWLDSWDTYGSCTVPTDDENRARTFFERVINLTQELNVFLYPLIWEFSQRRHGFSVRRFRNAIAFSLEINPNSFRIHFGPGEEAPIVKRLTFCFNLQFRLTDCNPPLRVAEDVEEPDERTQVILLDIRDFVVIPDRIPRR